MHDKIVDFARARVQGISGVPKLPPGYNPATWMLEVSGGGAKMHIDAVDVDFAAQYHASALCAEAEQRVDAVVAERAAATAPLALATRYAVPFAQQTKMVVWKEAIVYWFAPRPSSCPTPAAGPWKPRHTHLSSHGARRHTVYATGACIGRVDPRSLRKMPRQL